MSYAALRNSLLAARDARQAALLQALGQGRAAVLFLSLGIPGADKTPPGSGALFHWARGELEAGWPDLIELHAVCDSLGPFAILGTAGEPEALKRCCVCLEGSRPFARLIDADVYDGRGVPVDRALLGLPQRPCLVCDRPARECIRLGRHSGNDMLARMHELLRPFCN